MQKKHNPSHVQRHTLPSQLLITQFRLSIHNPSRVSQHQKQTQYSMLQIKTLFLKTPFDLRHLTSSSSSFLLFLTNLARALQHSARKQHNVNTHTLQRPIIANKPTSPAKHNKNSSYKMVPPR